MDTPAKAIGPLDKVHLIIKAVARLGNEAAETIETQAALIYGIGTAGVTPFEKMLHAKSTGDQFSLPIEPGVDTASSAICSAQWPMPFAWHPLIRCM